MKVCVIGLGYIGLPTSAVLAQAGHQVVGVDVNQVLVERVQNGDIPIVIEDGLVELAQEALRSGGLRVGMRPESADVFVIAVPTPFKGEHDTAEALKTNPQADLSYVEAATMSVSPYLKTGDLLILESTVPPGTTRGLIADTLTAAGVDLSGILVAHAPERVLPGNIVQELIHNDRIVGGLTPEATQVACRFYESFVKGRVVATDATTAELVKLMENTFRDVNIALANEFAMVGEHLGVNIWEAINLANLHPRVNFLRPGPGVGGHCIAVDPYFVIEAAPHLTPLIQAARQVNRAMPGHVLELFLELTHGLSVRKVAILGASYKANVGDERESPALHIAHLLEGKGYDAAIHDPYITQYNRPVDEVLLGADVALLLTDHKVYREIDPAMAVKLMSSPLLLDARGHLDADRWGAAGFKVMQLGAVAAFREVPTGV